MANPFDKAKEAADKAKEAAEKAKALADAATDAVQGKAAQPLDAATSVVSGAVDKVADKVGDELGDELGDETGGATRTTGIAGATQQIVSTVATKKVVEKVGVGRRAALWPLLLLAPIGLGIFLLSAKDKDKDNESVASKTVAVATDGTVNSDTDEVVMTEPSTAEIVARATEAGGTEAGGTEAGGTEAGGTEAAAPTAAATTTKAAAAATTTKAAAAATTTKAPATEVAPAAATEVAIDSPSPLPLVVGQTEGAAKTTLETAGLLVVVNQKPVSNPADVGRVIEQSPKEGDLVKGSTITLVIGVEEGSDTSTATNGSSGAAVPQDGVVNLTG